MKLKYILTSATLFLGVASYATSLPVAQTPKVDDGFSITLPELKKSAEKLKIKISGYAQAQYVYADSENSVANYSGFNIRRAAISVKGELDENWSAEVGFEIDSAGKGGKANDIFIDKATLAYKGGVGKLLVGYQKPAFVLEEYASSKTALCVEHSIASQYINKIPGLSGRHGGVWWSGKISELNYGIAITNANSNDFDKASNGFACYGNIGYAFKEDNFAWEIGLNGTFNQGENDVASTAPAGKVYGLEPFLKFTSSGLTGILDIIWVDGDKVVLADSAFGGNATLGYRMKNHFEPVARIAYLNVGDNLNVGANLLKNVPASGSGMHKNAKSAYLGVNYYANRYVKISAGYEYAILGGGAVADESSNAFRIQFQAAF